VEAAEHTDIILVAHDKNEIDVMSAYRAIFAYACVESFGWLEDTIQHQGHLQFTAPANMIFRNEQRVIHSRTNHQPK
jgi:hypothetical protein